MVLEQKTAIINLNDTAVQEPFSKAPQDINQKSAESEPPNPVLNILEAYSSDPDRFVQNILYADNNGLTYTYSRRIEDITRVNEEGAATTVQEWQCLISPFELNPTDPRLTGIEFNRIKVSGMLSEMTWSEGSHVTDDFNNRYDRLKAEHGAPSRIDASITRRL